jgi:hypothetical protein
MSFPQLVGSQFGYQKVVSIPALPNQNGAPATNTPILAQVVLLAGGLWVCNVNRLEAVVDNFAGGDRLNNYRVSIYYGAIVPAPATNIVSSASIVGDAVYSIDLPTICIVKTDGVTPISIGIYGATTLGGTWSCDGGDAVFTRLY